MADGLRVQITGIKEFNAGLRKMDKDLPKATRIALNGAVNLVVDYAKPRIPTLTGAARASLKARSSQRDARVAAGGRKAPYYPWLDFGGQAGSHKAQRPFYKEGRYIYPALRAKRDDFTAAMEAGIVAIATDAGVEVT